MAKANDAFRTIGEVSDELDVPKHVLRFWEGKFPQLKPMKRGGGRRFYRPEDVALLRGIHHLLHSAGYTIKGVQRILREDGVETVKAAAGVDSAPAHASTVAVEAQPVPSARRLKVKRGTAAAVPLPAALRTQLLQVLNEVEGCLALARGGQSEAPKTRREAGAKSRR